MSILTRGFGEGGGLITRGHGVIIQAVEVLTAYTSQVARKYSDDIFHHKPRLYWRKLSSQVS